MKNNRLFWLGMHKILVQTELPRLRELGFEVFNPPYLSSVKDQSACLEWDANQPTTLPPEIFEKLSKYSFFYNRISKEIEKILNLYFDAIIVTISPAWLVEVLKAYQGKIIYRTYGQHYLLSKELTNNKAFYNIVSRDNFWFVPHAEEVVSEEDSWLREREVIIPYCLTDDIIEHLDTWENDIPKKPEIALTCPNITNDYFHEHYKFLKQHFNDSFYKYYGVQISQVKDPRIVGTLERNEFISCLKKSAGYLYTYSEKRVCYLPPIEMMMLGGPVLYLTGSLLDQYFHFSSPGRCQTIEEAHQKSKLLIQGDRNFIEEVIASQKEVRKRYMPETIWPLFDRTFQDILHQENHASSWLAVGPESLLKKNKRIYVFHHFPGSPIAFKDGQYFAYDGIPRVIRQVISILASSPNVEVVITAYEHQVSSLNGYFRSIPNHDRVRILCINSQMEVSRVTIRSWFKKILKSTVKKFTSPLWRIKLKKFIVTLKHIFKLLSRYRPPISTPSIELRWYIKLINNDDSAVAILVPHYYYFPDALELKRKIILYLPDYMPHFFHQTGEFSEDEGKHTEIGRLLAKKADKIFCNSQFTKSYLPESRLKVLPEKIQVAYLPFLNNTNASQNHSHSILNKKIETKPYIFYPTRAHPNKNLSFLLKIVEELINRGHDIHLVLTTTIECDPKATKVFHSMKHKKNVLFLDIVTDDDLAQLYINAAALCFTSLAEGNFPPQIHEALRYQTPIVCGRLKFITERIPEHLLDSILFCEPNNEREFVTACEFAFQNRSSIIEKQKPVLHALEDKNTLLSFRRKIFEIFNLNAFSTQKIFKEEEMENT